MPFEHAMINDDGYVRPCCSWDMEVDKDDDPWPNIKEGGLSKAVHHKKFRQVRQDILNGKDVDGCRKCHLQEKVKGSSFRKYRNHTDRDFINSTEFTADTHVLRYIETGFSILCNLSCRMCWAGLSSTYWRITRPGTKIGTAYNFNNGSYDSDLTQLSEIKVVGGEPLMEQKHDDFIHELIKQDIPDNQLKMTYHTNATMLPSKKVQEFWKRCKLIQLNLSIDSYDKNNWEQRPGPYTWQDILAVCDQYKEWAKEWGNIRLNIGGTLTKINIFHVHEMEQWVKDYWQGSPGWGSYGFQLAERPVQLSITDWKNNPERVQQVTEYVNTKIESLELQRHILSAFEEPTASGNTDFDSNQKLLDEYYGYNILQWL